VNNYLIDKLGNENFVKLDFNNKSQAEKTILMIEILNKKYESKRKSKGINR
jgi:hypothetical protein